MTNRIELVLKNWAVVAATCVAFSAQMAGASIETWTFSGTLVGNTIQPDPILVDGVPGTTANLTAAGVVVGATFTATISFDTNETELLANVGMPDPALGLYANGAFNWTLGSLSARTAHRSQAILIADGFDVAVPPDPPLIVDVIGFSGGAPPAFNGGTFNLEVLTVDPDPNVPGDLGLAPQIALAMLPGTLADNSLLVNPPFLILDRGFQIPLTDMSTGQTIVLAGPLPSVSGGGTIPTCTSGDTDSDTICNDVDLCPANYDINQSDTDLNGNGDACNDVFDTDGDEWEDSLDNCPTVFNLLNDCAAPVPVLSSGSHGLLVVLLGMASIAAILVQRRRN